MLTQRTAGCAVSASYAADISDHRWICGGCAVQLTLLVVAALRYATQQILHRTIGIVEAGTQRLLHHVPAVAHLHDVLYSAIVLVAHQQCGLGCPWFGRITT